MDKITIKVPETPKLNLGATEERKFSFGTTETSKLRKEINEHVSNKKNPHGVTKEQLELSNVDNTADADKPISTLMQKALDGKANVFTVENLQKEVENISEDVNKNKSNIDAMSNELSKTSSALPFKADKSSLEATQDEVAQHAGNNDAHVTPEDKQKWNNKYTKEETDAKFALIENGVIDVIKTYVNIDDIPLLNGNGEEERDFYIPGSPYNNVFKIKIENENTGTLEYVYMLQTYSWENMGASTFIVQTIVTQKGVLTRKITESSKPSFKNLSEEATNNAIEELRGDIHAEILHEGNGKVLYIMNNRFKLFD